MSTLRDLEGNIIPTPSGPSDTITASDVTVPPGLPGDPTNVQEMGAAYAALLPTVDEKAALDGAAAPAADNVFATVGDIPAPTVPTLADVLGAGNDAGGTRITNLNDPIDPADAANKEYVDGGISSTPTLAEVLAAGNNPNNQGFVGLADPGGATGASLGIGDGAGSGIGGGINATGGSGSGDIGGDISFTGGTGPAGSRGGLAQLVGGTGNGGTTNPASFSASGGGPASHGVIFLGTANSLGLAGQFLASNGSSGMVHTTPLIRHAAGVPAGAPGVAELPIAFDSTAVTGGLYYWSGAAWVKVSTIP